MCSGGKGETRLMIRARTHTHTEANKRNEREIERDFLGRIIMMMSTTKRDLKGNYGNVDTVA